MKYIVCLLFPILAIGLFVACPVSQEVILNVALSGSPDTLDPHRTTSTLTFQVTRSVYDTLVEPNENGEIVPALAKRWVYTDDATRLTVTLRKNANFHDGTPLTARDVIASLERLQGAESPRAGEYAAIVDIEKISEYEIAIVLSQPAPALIATLASGWSAILPAHLIEEEHDFSTTPHGSGPFVFGIWSAGSAIEMVRNPHYWQKNTPIVAGVTFHILTENVIRVQGLLNGAIDVVDVIDAADIPMLQENSDITVHERIAGLTMVIAINTTRPPLDALPFREALSLAVDKQRVLDQAYGGGEPIATFIDYSDPSYPDISDQYSYDPERAAQIAAEYAIEQPLTMVLPQNFQPHVRAGEIYQQMFAEVGIPVELVLVDWPTWINEVYLGSDFDLTVIGHTGHLDPSPRFDELAYTGWSNQQLNELVAAAAVEGDPQQRTALYHQAFEIIAAELPFVFVGTNIRHVTTRSAVDGVHIDSKLDTFDFRQARVSDR